MRTWKFIGAISLVVSVLLPNVGLAWGIDGHRAIALIAEAQLSLKAKAEVARLLTLEPGQTMASLSTWADEHRNQATAPWHYMNFPRGTCSYEQERDCPNGKCVVGAIERQIEIINSGGTDEGRLVALKYLIHLVGDVHQPLHAGYLDDKGGNTYQLHAFNHGSNLHALWDTGLIKNLNETPESLAARLARSDWVARADNFDPVIAAEESCRIVGLPGYYPERRIGSEYINRFTPLVEQRLATAGARLAELLNRVFR
jgi:hypothetical protein